MNEISTALKTLTDRITVKLEIGKSILMFFYVLLYAHWSFIRSCSQPWFISEHYRLGYSC